jgi:hypothetical protein
LRIAQVEAAAGRTKLGEAAATPEALILIEFFPTASAGQGHFKRSPRYIAYMLSLHLRIHGWDTNKITFARLHFALAVNSKYFGTCWRAIFICGIVDKGKHHKFLG